jgi:hypothetical protein
VTLEPTQARVEIKTQDQGPVKRCRAGR